MPNSKILEMELSENKTIKYLRSLTITFGLAAIAVGAIYAFASEGLVRRALPPEQMTIVVRVEELGPVWPFLFFFSGLTLIISAVLKRGVIISHGCAFFAWGFYGAAILIGSSMSRPPAPILFGTVSVFLAVGMWFIAKIWASEGVK